MSHVSEWAAIAASLSAVGALLNAFTALFNRYDSRIKAVKDLLAARADFINSHVLNGVISTNDPFVMRPVCNQVLQAENDIKSASNVLIIRVICRFSTSNIERELRSHFFTLLHSSLQQFFSKGEEGGNNPNDVKGQIDGIKNIYKKF